jgi:altronate hydrolase
MILGDYNKNKIKFVVLQEEKNEEKKVDEKLSELIDYASQFKRQEVPLSKLKIGLKCGGSDSFSGITANPLLGKISDKLVSHGGTSILTEVPEFFGAEKILMNRAKNKEIFNDIVNLINRFKDYFIEHKQNIYENPSPGNKEGGITTLEEKSLGNIQKGGHSVITGVKDYGEIVDKPGLNLVYGPGNDLVSSTVLTAAGAQIILFSTGRGTPYGSPVPTIKIATNNRLAKNKKNWIDFNAGTLLKGKDLEELAEEFFDYIIDIADKNEITLNEKHNFKEIAIFKDGVTL